MNIFVLSRDPVEAARFHCDRHICKMILEYGQLLSTAHRLLDGRRQLVSDDGGQARPKNLWLLDSESFSLENVDGRFRWVIINPRCYQVAHPNHPCTIWTRQTAANYLWLFRLFEECNQEYTRRYGRRHAAARLHEFLSAPPRNITPGQLTPFAQAMPNQYRHEDAVEAYRRFYAGAKSRFARWRSGEPPAWYLARTGAAQAQLREDPVVA